MPVLLDGHIEKLVRCAYELEALRTAACGHTISVWTIRTDDGEALVRQELMEFRIQRRADRPDERHTRDVEPLEQLVMQEDCFVPLVPSHMSSARLPPRRGLSH